jgi:uncharacterized OsmC-like protein
MSARHLMNMSWRHEYVMAALGACTAMTLRLSADRHHWPLEKASVVVKHAKIVSADGKTFVDKFERMIHLQGELTDEQRATCSRSPTNAR